MGKWLSLSARVQAARDIGAPVRYQGLKERLSQAKDRSGRIQRARWALRSESRHLWKCVSSSTLYASEPLGLGQSRLDSLRTAIANAIVGDTCQSMNLALFLSCLDFLLVDPHLPSAGSERSSPFSTSLFPRTVAAFPRLASARQSLVGRSVGPAIALSIQVAAVFAWSTIRQISWLCSSSLAGASTCVAHSAHIGTVSRDETLEVLQRFSDHRQVSVCMVGCTTWYTGTAVTPLPCVKEPRAFIDNGSSFASPPAVLQHESGEFFSCYILVYQKLKPVMQCTSMLSKLCVQCTCTIIRNMEWQGLHHIPSSWAFYESDRQRRQIADQFYCGGSLQILSLSSLKPDVVRSRISVGLNFGHLFGHARPYRVSSCILIVLLPCWSGSRRNLQKTSKKRLRINRKRFGLLKRLCQAKKSCIRLSRKFEARRDPHEIGPRLERYYNFEMQEHMMKQSNLEESSDGISLIVEIHMPKPKQDHLLINKTWSDHRRKRQFLVKPFRRRTLWMAAKVVVWQSLFSNGWVSSWPSPGQDTSTSYLGPWTCVALLGPRQLLAASSMAAGFSTLTLWADTAGPMGHHVGISWLEIAYAGMLQYVLHPC